jgi:ABC-2 type transport system ATP-binding protein
VRDVSFALPEGSITALVGPNGAGKSTLIRACIGFESPDEGRVLVRDVDPRRDRVRAVMSVGYVPQAASLYRSLSIDDHLTMAVAARPTFDVAVARERLLALGLTPDRTVGELSGGEQAQVSLALALGSRAPVLLLDEPLASLDPLARRDFLTTLTDDVRSRGATALLSSHIVTDVEQACDRIVLLASGRLLLDASVADVLERFDCVPATDPKRDRAIGTFAGPDGQSISLVPSEPGGRRASLEEVVLGHLAAGRGRAPGAAA